MTRHANTVLVNGNILTVDAEFSRAEAVAIADGRFAAVGSQSDIEASIGPDTKVIDLKGKTVVPGLIDSHFHLLWNAATSAACDLLPARSVADVQRAVAETASRLPEGAWVVAGPSWHEGLLAEQRMPTRWELDEAVPDKPVFIPRGGHVSTCNSRALEIAGIDDETPDPNGGVIVRRPSDGKATGMLLDNANMLMRRVLPPPAPVERQMEWLSAHMARMNARGLVHATEPSIDQRAFDVYRAMREAGRMTMRVDMLWRFYSREEAVKVAGLADFQADDVLRFSGGKYMIDGGIEGAWLSEPYLLVEGEQSDPGYHGLKMLPPGGEDELFESFLVIARAGLQLQCHAVGDAAIDAVLRAYSRVNDRVPIAPLRWAVMHAHLPSDAAIAQMRQLGVVVTIQDHSVLLGTNMLRWWGRDRAAYAAPTRKLIDAGLLVSGGTDAPVVPNDPFLCLSWLVTRETLHGEVLGGGQAITPREALELYTIRGAQVIGVSDSQGSIEAGKLADLAVLSQDITTVDPDRIRDTEVLLTLLGGRIVHDAGAL